MAGKTKKNAHLWERHPDDWYVEERFATRELLKRETFPGFVYDPCCGRGHILAEARAAGYVAYGTDISARKMVAEAAAAFCGDHDFLAEPPGRLIGEDTSVIMNPPFRHGDAATGIEGFVRHAMAAPGTVKIAAFVPARFLWGAERARGFHTGDRPAARVYMITPRPSCPPGPVWEDAPEEVGGGAEEFAWMVWEKDPLLWWERSEPPQLFWIVGER